MARKKSKGQLMMYGHARDSYVPVPDELRGAYKLYEHLANLQSAAQQMKNEHGGCSDSALAQAFADFIINVTVKLGVQSGVIQSDGSLQRLAAVYNEKDFSRAANKAVLMSTPAPAAARQGSKPGDKEILSALWELAIDIYPSLRESEDGGRGGAQPGRDR